MLVIIQVLIEKVMGIGGQALATFIDYSKAFNSISHVQLIDIMLELGFPEHIVALLQSLYIDQTAVIRWNGCTTETFPNGKVWLSLCHDQSMQASFLCKSTL